MTRFILASLTILLVAACSAAAPNPSPTPGASADPSASGSSGGQPSGDSLALLTQPPAGPDQACMEALAMGVLALHPQSGLGLAQPDGQVMAVSWPHGYTARVVETTLVLFDHEGNALAKLGDPINLGGGFGNNVWYTCHGQLSVAAP